MDFTLKLSSFLVIVLCLLISLRNESAQPDSFPDAVSISGSSDVNPMRLDFYRESCPLAEKILRSTFLELFNSNPDIAPALIRLLFHDCFVHGCDASVLLDSANGIVTERKAPPNQSLKHLEAVYTIKSRLEETCPEVVSCADIVVLAARESVLATGGPFYPLHTGRRDSTNAFANETSDLPSPHDDLRTAVASFASKGFSERELVILLGAHSTGTIHCEFINRRLHNFTSTGGPDPSIDPEFLETLRAKCNGSRASSPPSSSPSSSPSPAPSSPTQDPGMRMDYEGPGKNFGTLYYRSLLQRKGLTFLDQQMTSSEETERLVNAYASEASQFQKDFSLSMMKLSNLQVLTAPMGQIRLDCRRVN